MIFAREKEGSLKVVHKYGPCNQHHEDKATVPPSHSEILLQDQSRVNSIRSRVLKNRKQTNAAVDVEAKSGDSLGSGNYIVTVGLGTPKKDLSLIFDTGSPLTWTQCLPCSSSCYYQKDPMFDPSKSSTYINVSCYTPECASETSTCIYGIQYGDRSYSVGYFGKETITLSKYDVFDGFLFGCGHKNRGLFGRTAGLLGLGRDTFSIVQQTSNIYKRIFSYCLPTHFGGSTGHLTFGRTPVSYKDIKYTPLSTSTDIKDSFYALDLEGITVAGTKLYIPSSIFSSPGTIIDSGTVITRLPATAYKALKSAFRQFMSSYPRAPALSILDTCYDFSSYSSFKIPKISFLFGGGVVVELKPQGILYVGSVTQICLAFAGYSDDDEVTIFGNAQQQTLEVVYDAGEGRIGFGPVVCH
ncbi:hypothetical protein FEM48_Zijuj06G0063700 [Ziziphus jujuba var. spinosa]|uniref:Peptidase A1 domain-containing protein n=1 Tax=Ziziphus jujuba var. spinosa TaxID=714518 RepID=A0A978V7N9_ZIZJJ|nr:hypothetical protein FEM48_Zijuj06G0063700 [Ziziphus jujuba var. spinosa]